MIAKCYLTVLSFFHFALHPSFCLFSRVHATLYPTVSVRRLVGWLVGPSVGNAFVFLAFSGSFRITAPAQSHATDSAVYTALFLSISLFFSPLCFFRRFKLKGDHI